jgi:hypothetical protein
MVHIWCIYGAYMVHIWCIYGAYIYIYAYAMILDTHYYILIIGIIIPMKGEDDHDHPALMAKSTKPHLALVTGSSALNCAARYTNF